MRLLLILGLLGLIVCPLKAQEDSLRQIDLAEISVYGLAPPAYTFGNKISRLDSLSLEQAASQNLGELLQQQSGIYIREYGNGQLGTISFRGTGAGHTAVLWQGMPINSPTLGLSDFATLPVFALDAVELHYGASSAWYGSDALGGAILLGKPEGNWQAGSKLSFSQEVGSFGRYFTGAKASFAGKKWQTRTKVYHQLLENDFPFTDPRGQEQSQTNAALRQYGWVQGVDFRPNERHLLSIDAWYAYNHREIQPSMLNLQNEDALEDENLRLVANYQQDNAWGLLQARLGFAQNIQRYVGDVEGLNESWQYFGSLQYQKALRHNLSLSTGINWQTLAANTLNYKEKVWQNRQDIFLMLNYRLFPNWQLSFNLRQAFNEGQSAPLTPSISSRVTLFNDKTQELLWKASASRSYRFPTLNDLFWSPGGNPKLRPEQGWGLEQGWQYRWQKNKQHFELAFTTFYNWVEDWVIWLPEGNVWSPDNLRRVQSYGAELEGTYQKTLGSKWQLLFKANYAYNIAQNRSTAEAPQFFAKQMPYMPKHCANAFLNINYQKTSITLHWQYTGLRYETLDNIEDLLNSVPAYDLWHWQIQQNFDFKNHILSLNFRVNNLLNKDYQNVLFRAMPGRNYQIKLTYQFL